MDPPFLFLPSLPFPFGPFSRLVHSILSLLFLSFFLASYTRPLDCILDMGKSDLTGNKFRSVSLKPERERERRTHRRMDNWIGPVSFHAKSPVRETMDRGNRCGILERRIIGKGELEKEIECPLFHANLITIFLFFFFSLSRAWYSSLLFSRLFFEKLQFRSNSNRVLYEEIIE